MDADQFEQFMSAFQSQLTAVVKAMTDVRTADSRPASSLMSELSLRIQKFEYDADVGYQFSKWYDRHSGVITVDGASLDDSSRVRLLLERLSDDVFEKYKRQILPKGTHEIKYKETVDLLRSMFDTKVSLHTIRFQCLNMKQNADEDFVTYTGRVNQMCEQAQIPNLGAEGLKCLIWIIGLRGSNDPTLRAHLLSFLDKEDVAQRQPTLHDLYAECDRITTLRSTAKFLDQENSQVKAVDQNDSPTHRNTVCVNCERPNHRSVDCRFPKVTCSICKKQGHKDRFCFSNKKKSNPTRKIRKKIVNTVASESNAEVNAVRRYTTIKVDSTPVEFLVDSGADVTLLSERDWERMGKPTLQPVFSKLTGAGGDNIKIRGVGECKFEYHGILCSGRYYVVPGDNLLGLEWLDQSPKAKKLLDGLVSQVSTVKTENLSDHLKGLFPDVFKTGLGRCTMEKASLTLEPNAQPKFCPKRPVPHTALAAVEAELNRLLEMNVIEPTNHSMWAAPIVTVRKPGKIRVCVDFSTGLNKALLNDDFPLPLIEDVFTCLNGGTLFSQIDFSDAYLQVELDDVSKNVVVMNTHKGLFRYNRLPFGIKTAPAIFQRIMSKLCSGLNGVIAYLDDVLIVGKTIEEHDANLLALFSRIQEYGFRVKVEKCAFRRPEIKFLGYIVDASGRHPNPEKVKAIQDMKVPNDESQLRSFLGMVSYYGNFLAGLKDLRSPLDALLHKDVKWHWGNSQQKVFDELKSVLTSDLNIAHFDPKLPLIIAADASNYGIGMVLSHKYPDGSEKPLSHASRSLTAAEKGYSQIEKEGLALVSAVKRFHKYVFGKKFLLRTDHKPLLAIFGHKAGVPVHSANRLMRWSLILTAYDFSIEYVNTLEFGQADALSRLMQATPVNEDEDLIIASVEKDVKAVFDDNIRRIPVNASEIRSETNKDPVLKQVLKAVQSQTWHSHLSPALKPFYNRRNSLTVHTGCLMDNDRIVVPFSLQRDVLKELHIGHPGIVQMKALARSHVYWPHIDEQCEKLVKSCLKCQESAKTPIKVPLSPWAEPNDVWERIHIDYAGPIEGLYYLVIVDSKSKWPEILTTKEITATKTISLLTSVFMKYGFPKVLVSDNGTQFTSELFATMCSRFGIKHMRTAPYTPQSNGQAERFVDTLKRGLKKLKGEGTPSVYVLDSLLFTYRLTPRDSINGLSPAEVFLNRKLRSRLTLLAPSDSNVEQKLDYKAESMKSQFDSHHGVKLRRYAKGDKVMTKYYSGLNWSWKPAIVKSKLGSVLYQLELNDQLIRRHANQMRKIEEVNPQSSEVEFWLEAFDLSQNSQAILGPKVIPQPPVPPPVVPPLPVQPTRCSTRVRKPVVRYQAS